MQLTHTGCSARGTAFDVTLERRFFYSPVDVTICEFFWHVFFEGLYNSITSRTSTLNNHFNFIKQIRYYQS